MPNCEYRPVDWHARPVDSVMNLYVDYLVRELTDPVSEEVHFPEALVRAVVEEFSAIGDTVLDPFAGYGTTLVVSEAMGRSAIGVELLPRRADTTRRRLGPSSTIHVADARRLDELALGTIDLCLTSPPYMSAVDHPQNTLTAYTTMDGSYPTYLAELTNVFVTVISHLRVGGHLVINAANIRTGNVVTTLAWDIAHALKPYAAFRGETYLRWDRPPAMFSGDYCMVFQKPA
jgi:DNA modification methylase